MSNFVDTISSAKWLNFFEWFSRIATTEYSSMPVSELKELVISQMTIFNTRGFVVPAGWTKANKRITYIFR